MVRAALRRPAIAALPQLHASPCHPALHKYKSDSRRRARRRWQDDADRRDAQQGRRLRNSGRVDAGSATTDFLVQERERGITIQSAAAHFEWSGTNIVLVDTPGHVDFGFEVDRTLRAVDGVVWSWMPSRARRPERRPARGARGL